MISDINLQIASAQAINVAAATEVQTEDSIDVGGTALTEMSTPEGTKTGTVLDVLAAGGALQRDISEGEPLYMVFTITTAITGVTTAKFRVIHSANANLSSGRIMVESDAIPIASLTAGTQVVMRIQFDPANPEDTLERYFGGALIGTGTGPMVGTIDCHIVHGNQAGGKKFYPTAIPWRPGDR